MYKSIIKIICLLIVASLGWVGVLAIGQTFTHFHDMETSVYNTFQAGTLDFSLYLVYLEHDDDEVEKTIKIENKGNLSFRYIVRVETSGDSAFCNTLQLEVYLGDMEKHDDDLINFEPCPIKMINQNGIHTWKFEVSLPDNDSFIGQRCEFKFVFKAWQTDLDTPNLGFRDREETENISINNNDNDNKNDENGDEGVGSNKNNNVFLKNSTEELTFVEYRTLDVAIEEEFIELEMVIFPLKTVLEVNETSEPISEPIEKLPIVSELVESIKLAETLEPLEPLEEPPTKEPVVEPENMTESDFEMDGIEIDGIEDDKGKIFAF